MNDCSIESLRSIRKETKMVHFGSNNAFYAINNEVGSIESMVSRLRREHKFDMQD